MVAPTLTRYPTPPWNAGRRPDRFSRTVSGNAGSEVPAAARAVESPPRTVAGERAARRRRARVGAVRRPPSGVLPSGHRTGASVSADVAAEWERGGFRLGRWARLTCMLTLLGAAVVVGVVLLSPGPVQSVTDVVVQPGDSLWSIALRTDPGADPRQVVARIRDLNAIRGDVITAGTMLQVPTEAG